MESLQHIVQKEGVIALYEYDNDKERIPVVIIESDETTKQDRRIACPWTSYRGLIILTIDDVRNGSDAFALTFVHLQKYAILIAGQDVFANMWIAKNGVRLQIEVLARQLLIDAREHQHQGHDINLFATYINRASGRIMAGYSYLGMTYEHTITKTKERPQLIENLLAIANEIDTIDI